ncbi:hypothetical protein [Novosphingobium sp. B1]|uniref:hypothetical protein n=1 Tax=Novosphingobium sp. B1 TaxID=1938756 RepID=UPI00111C0A05|nr:hypothetical protein [Novosphingobium sp. B1]
MPQGKSAESFEFEPTPERRPRAGKAGDDYDRALRDLRARMGNSLFKPYGDHPPRRALDGRIGDRYLEIGSLHIYSSYYDLGTVLCGYLLNAARKEKYNSYELLELCVLMQEQMEYLGRDVKFNYLEVDIRGKKISVVIVVGDSDFLFNTYNHRWNFEPQRSRTSFRFIDRNPQQKRFSGEPNGLSQLVDRALRSAGVDPYHGPAVARALAEEMKSEGLTLGPSAELSALPAVSLPDQAPEIYQGLRGPETPPEFVKRVYGPWLGQGLTRADIRKLDPKLSVAITNWLSRSGNEWPADVDLPTKAEQNERLLSAGPDAIREHLGKFTGQEALREAARINAAAHYRK